MIPEVHQAKSRLADLCVRHNVRRLEIFGSARDPSLDASTSALCVIVKFGPFPAGGYSEHYFALLEELRDLFNRPAELLVDGPVRNPYLLEIINRSRELLYAA